MKYMLKIYEASLQNRNIVLNNYITFENGMYDTGYDGYGYVYAGKNCIKANYNLETLKTFREYVKNLKMEDNYVKDFIIFNPIDNSTLEEKILSIKDKYEYEKYGINEEGILLFTKNLSVEYNKDFVEKNLVDILIIQ